MIFFFSRSFIICFLSGKWKWSVTIENFFLIDHSKAVSNLIREPFFDDGADADNDWGFTIEVSRERARTLYGAQYFL